MEEEEQEEANLRQVLKLFKSQTKKECYSIKILKDDKEEPSILDDKLGGRPYLPKNCAYPTGKEHSKDKPLPLILQLNLSHIHLHNYPREGILELFMSSDYPFDYEIKYFKEVDEENYKTDGFPEFDKELLYFERGYKIQLEKAVDYMYSSDYQFEDTLLKIINKVYGKKYENVHERDDIVDYIEGMIEKIDCTFGGYPDFVQEDPRKEDNSKGECLLKMESIGDNPFGDCGVLFALINKYDIKKGALENASVDWDCS